MKSLLPFFHNKPNDLCYSATELPNLPGSMSTQATGADRCVRLVGLLYVSAQPEPITKKTDCSRMKQSCQTELTSLICILKTTECFGFVMK
jgi:hypothetical protein